MMVGDGSYSDILSIGAGAFILASADLSQYIIAGGPTPGSLEEQNPYRSEVGTILGMGIMATIIAKLTNSSPKIVIACDNDNALERPFGQKEYILANQQSSDLISTAHDIWTHSSTFPIPTKVTGHADDLGRPLTHLEQLNVIVDMKAKTYLHLRSCRSIRRNTDPNHGMIQISTHQDNISGRISKTWCEYIAKQRSITALIRSGKITKEQWRIIDENAIRRSQKLASVKQRIFRMKWISTQLPVGKRMRQRNQRLLDTCPCCSSQQETVAHLRQCQNEESRSAYLLALDKLEKWLQTVHTDPYIKIHLIAVLQTMRTGGNTLRNLFPNVLMKPEHYEAFFSQHELGWEQFHDGIITFHWARLQDKYYRSIGSRRSGRTWAADLVTQLWNVNWQVWNHRNKSLHESINVLDNLKGRQALLDAITHELNRGKDELHENFSPFFSFFSPQTITQEPTDKLRQWFYIIRSARESNNTDRKDEFSQKGPLRKWVGLLGR